MAMSRRPLLQRPRWEWLAGLVIGLHAAASTAGVDAGDDKALARYSLTDVQVRLAAMALSDHTGVAVAMESAVKGNVNLVSNREVDRREAISLFLEAIEARGWQAEFDEQCRLYLRGRQPFLTALQTSARMYRVYGMSAAEAAAVVRPMLSAQGELGTPDNQRLLVVDTAHAHVRVHLMSMDGINAGKKIGNCDWQSPPGTEARSAQMPVPASSPASGDVETPRLRFSRSLRP